MSTVHLPADHLQKIIDVLRSFPAIEKAAIFGSRALGTHKEGSDVDLVLYGDVTDETLGKVRTALDDTVLPYFFDVVAYQSIKHAPFVEHIDTYAQVIWNGADDRI